MAAGPAGRCAAATSFSARHGRTHRAGPDKLITDSGEVDYDLLLIATGPKYDWAVVPNFGPADGTTWSVMTKMKNGLVQLP